MRLCSYGSIDCREKQEDFGVFLEINIKILFLKVMIFGEMGNESGCLFLKMVENVKMGSGCGIMRGNRKVRRDEKY